LDADIFKTPFGLGKKCDSRFCDEDRCVLAGECFYFKEARGNVSSRAILTCRVMFAGRDVASIISTKKRARASRLFARTQSYY
jgi:hypothetical protein